MNPTEDQFCADTITKIITQASQNSKAASAVTPVKNINKAQVIVDFKSAGYKISGIRTFNRRSRAASVNEPVTSKSKAKTIYDFITSNGKIF